MSEEVPTKQPALFTEDVKQKPPQTRGALFPEGLGHSQDVASRIVLSSNVPISEKGWLEIQPQQPEAAQPRKAMTLKRVRRKLNRMWSRYSLWQYVLILVLAVATILMLNTLTQPTIKPGTMTGPRR
jgi:hypothetical protein